MALDAIFVDLRQQPVLCAAYQNLQVLDQD